MAIQLFACKRTRTLFSGLAVPGWAGIERVAMRKLAMLHAASSLDDLRAPPGNHLEPLQGDRNGQYSIRVNNRYRVCFRWSHAGPTHVEILDYH